MVAYTLVLPELRRVVELEAAQRNIPTADIMGPAMEAFAQIMKKEPYLEPGRVRRLDEDYFRRIAAVEFAVKYDDGKDPRGPVSYTHLDVYKRQHLGLSGKHIRRAKRAAQPVSYTHLDVYKRQPVMRCR